MRGKIWKETGHAESIETAASQDMLQLFASETPSWLNNIKITLFVHIRNCIFAMTRKAHLILLQDGLIRVYVISWGQSL